MGQTTNLNWWTQDFWTINSIFRPTSLIFWMSFMPCNSSPESFTMRSPTSMDSVGCSAFHWESTPFESQSVSQVMISSGWFAQGCSVVGKKWKKSILPNSGAKWWWIPWDGIRKTSPKEPNPSCFKDSKWISEPSNRMVPWVYELDSSFSKSK